MGRQFFVGGNFKMFVSEKPSHAIFYGLNHLGMAH